MKEPINLILDMYEITEHAQIVMKNLGIKYQYAIPQSMGDCWWFMNCTNVPEKLPDYFKELTTPPHDLIGYGLSKEMADNIVNFKNDYPRNHHQGD